MGGELLRPNVPDADGPSFRMHFDRTGRAVRMRLVGEFDVFAEELFLGGIAALGEDLEELIVDLSDLGYCSATSIRVMNDERERLTRAGVRFVIRLGDGFTRRLFELLALEWTFFYEDRRPAGRREPRAGPGGP